MPSPLSPRRRTTRCLARYVVATGAALALAVGAAAPASAHIAVSATPAQAAATDAVVTFVAEAESTTAGITSLQVQLPTGITPTSVRYLDGPPGWTFTTTTDGYTVAGPALPAGQDATYRIKITKLPDATSVAFKTLQFYSDGCVDRWIETAPAGAPEPENPAPVLALAPAPAAQPTTTAAATVTSTTPAQTPTSTGL
jgi:uncharacterized protein YcnI